MDTEEQTLRERLSLLPEMELETTDTALIAIGDMLRIAHHDEAGSFLTGVRQLLDQERCRRRMREEGEVADLEDLLNR